MLFNNKYIHRQGLSYFTDTDSDDSEQEDEENGVLNYEARPMQNGHNTFRQEFVRRYFS